MEQQTHPQRKWSRMRGAALYIIVIAFVCSFTMMLAISMERTAMHGDRDPVGEVLHAYAGFNR